VFGVSFSLSIPAPRLPLRRPWGGRRIASRIGDIFHHLWCHKRPPIASGGSGWKDTTGPGCLSAGIFLVDSLKFGTDFRLNHTWKNGRSAFAFLGTGWAIFFGGCLYFFEVLSFVPLQGGKNKGTKTISLLDRDACAVV
jgi:hypothetical protein